MSKGASLNKDDAVLVYLDAVESASKFSASAVKCAPLTEAAFRCAESKGVRHPLCLQQLSESRTCVAREIAPVAAAQLDRCRWSGQPAAECQQQEMQLQQEVTQQLNQHTEAISYSRAQVDAWLRCGNVAGAPLREQMIRGECLAPLICPKQVESGDTNAIWTCVGNFVSKTLFRPPEPGAFPRHIK